MPEYPVRVTARHDMPPNRWHWTVKWLLLLPHYLVLVGLWAAFAAGTLAGYVVVVVTGRYPRRLHAFGVGVLRWTWRVVYYGYVVLGTDRYPPFTLRSDADYPADVQIEATEERSRWLPLVAWLLALPHASILAGLLDVHLLRLVPIAGVPVPVPVGITSTGITVIAVQLTITGRHPKGLYDLFTGVARWALRTAAYVTLLTDAYPPFRLDQGGAEPATDPGTTPVDVRAQTSV